jgi:hypothetical protein
MARHSPLQDDHNPYKRLRSIGPGPRGREPLPQRTNWECNAVKGAPYVQMCIWVGPEGKGHRKGAKKVVKVAKAYKKAYNKEYNAWRKKQALKPRVNARQPNAPYRKSSAVIAYKYVPGVKAMAKRAAAARKAKKK